MRRPVQWTIIGATVAAAGLLMNAVVPIASAAPPWARGTTETEMKYISSEFSKVEGWGNILGKLASLVQQQQQEIDTLQSTVKTQQSELDAVMAHLGMNSGSTQSSTVSGTVIAYTAPTNTTDGSLTIHPSSGANASYPVATQVQITGSSSIHVGDTVDAQVTFGVVTAITDSGISSTSSTSVLGLVSSFTAPNGSTPGILTVQPATGSPGSLVPSPGLPVEILVPANVTITSIPPESVTLADLTPGTQVYVAQQYGVATMIDILY